MLEESIVQMGAIGVILFFTIKELFAFLRYSKGKDLGGHTASIDHTVLQQLIDQFRIQHENQQRTFDKGNQEVVKAITDSSYRQVEILARIEGSLKK